MLRQAQAFSRTGGTAAIGFAATIVTVNLIAVPAGMPSPGADPADVIGFFRTEGAVVGLSSALTPVAWVLATVFGAGAVATLWPAERAR
ncbi:hypothetical protein [Kineococcus glutinatus]|uniref:Uncharacterized protein n=1 Tax=Kineococcus glutinatus TaxID=1070872 RepID=A0ABP9HTZ0_9ACTN